MIPMIYMDNAATTIQKPDEVKAAVMAAFDSMGNAGRGASRPSLDASRVIYDTREKLARLFHGRNAKQIVFTVNSTESLNIAIKGLFQKGDHVITTVLEHNSVLRPLYECESRGMELTILGCDEKGNISYEEMEAAVRENTKAVIVSCIFCRRFSSHSSHVLYSETIRWKKSYRCLSRAGSIPLRSPTL